MRKYETLEKSLRSAHIPIPPGRYLLLTIILTIIAGSICNLAGTLVVLTGIVIPLPTFLPAHIFYLFSSVIITAAAGCLIYYYPTLKASGRKTRIDLDLPYAVTYMQALSPILSLADIFRNIHQEYDLYGEVSNECGVIIRNMDVFGEDLNTSIEHAKEITPSENFRELLNDLLLMHQSGGNLTNFFNAKSLAYREISRNEQDSLLQFLEMIAEIYVTVFVAGPIAIIIMLVAQNLTGQSTLGGITTLLYVGLPLGAIVLIAILYILLPPDNLAISHKEVQETEYANDILNTKSNEEPNLEFIKKVEKRKREIHILELLKHPVKTYIAKYDYAIVLGMIAAGGIFYLYYSGYLASVFPVFTFEAFLCLIIIAGIIPAIIAYELRYRYVNSIEKQMPEFLREIADMRDIGMTLQGAIFLIATNKKGVLSSEIKVVSDEIRYGTPLSNALVRMEERIGVITIKRAVSLLVKASEITDYIRETLAIAVSDLEHYLKMKSKRKNVSIVYLAVIYLSFGIYLYTAYQLNVVFISSFSSFDIAFDIMSNKTAMFHIGIILAFFSGIMAGQMSANTILSGLKHSALLLAATLIVFIYLI